MVLLPVVRVVMLLPVVRVVVLLPVVRLVVMLPVVRVMMCDGFVVLWLFCQQSGDMMWLSDWR